MSPTPTPKEWRRYDLNRKELKEQRFEIASFRKQN